jgi:hypothetical protein
MALGRANATTRLVRDRHRRADNAALPLHQQAGWQSDVGFVDRAQTRTNNSGNMRVTTDWALKLTNIEAHGALNLSRGQQRGSFRRVATTAGEADQQVTSM